jgi:hypothetical protein
VTHPDLSLPAASPAVPPVLPTVPLPAVPLRELAPFLLLAGLLLVLIGYFVGVEAGAVSLTGGQWVHEFVHDGRHLLGFPCH